MRRILIICSTLALLAVAGCGGIDVVDSLDDAGSFAAEPVEVAVMDESVASAGDFSPSITERLIIRNASLDLVVDDTEAAVAQIGVLVDDLDGFIVSSQMTQYDEGVRANLTMRVPAESFDTALVRLRDLAKEVRRQSTSGQDVTEEYSDLQAQLRHLEATEKQLLSFLEEAEDTESTLAVHSELRQIQGEIERVKGRIQYLEQSSALSTIQVELIPDELAGPISVAGWKPGGTLRRAFETLIRALQVLVDALIWVVVFVLPVFLLVFGVPILILVWLLRRSRRRRKTER
jgi:hypothetical protein